MRQPTIEIIEKYESDADRSYGIKNIMSLTWQRGKIAIILVDFYGNERDAAAMYDYDGTGIFKNTYGNLSGTITF